MRSAEDPCGVHASGFGSDNLSDHELTPTVAHSGQGVLQTARIADAEQLSFAAWIDYSEVPPGASIGTHRHSQDEEEFYLVLSGNARMQREESWFDLRAGDLVRNPPGGVHGLVNTSTEVLRLFVFCCGPAGRS